MNIDWNAFTPMAAITGGLLIGVAAAAFILLNGRIAGVSGILGGLLRSAPGDTAWRLAFLAGLAGAPLAYLLWAALPVVQIEAGWGQVIAGGLLVGMGTCCSAGCTSGHGVCGLARLSPRSLVATMTFMAAGFATVFAARHVIG